MTINVNISLAKYRDGVNEPRGGFSGPRTTSAESGYQSGPCNFSPADTFLPDARRVSQTFHDDDNSNDPQATHMLALFGQFLDHDITLTAETDREHCCTTNSNDRDRCFQLAVSPNDPFYSNHGVTCLEFSRSTPFCPANSQVREQFNEITAFVDASNVYGSDQATANLLRQGAFGKGELRVDTVQVSNNPPRFKEVLPTFFDAEENEFLERAGDSRAREQPALASLHTLFLREHNWIAREISFRNPGLSDEEVYQRARKIVGAEMQNIVYNEFLPIVLGNEAYSEGLVTNGDQRSSYRPELDPSINNEFSTAAFRFGHSMIQGIISMVTSFWQTFPLRFHFFNLEAYHFENSFGLEGILLEAAFQPAKVTNCKYFDPLGRSIIVISP